MALSEEELAREVEQLQRELEEVLRKVPKGERKQAVDEVRGVLNKLGSRPAGGDGEETTDDEGGAAEDGRAEEAAHAAAPQPAQPAAAATGGAPQTMEYGDEDLEQEDDTQVALAACLAAAPARVACARCSDRDRARAGEPGAAGKAGQRGCARAALC